MDEKQARKILGDTIKEDNCLYSLGGCVAWDTDGDDIFLSGCLSLDELEAITWWTENKREKVTNHA